MILLDTNVLLWFFAGNERLSVETRSAIADDPGNYIVSTISFWEIAIKRQIGKLTANLDVPQAIRNAGFMTLDITTAHICTYESLPLLHRDPFDRMLIAQSKTERLPLLTGDLKLKEYDVRIVSALG
ncbi:MAG TPA: type II toxin-antitoxin system VapC family toxin [Candidatus Saccharimonadales bacterium]|nr:type II toxin-antitoxin system VapC family toxin [Candidatus Saccharimonadales bacterium]